MRDHTHRQNPLITTLGSLTPAVLAIVLAAGGIASAQDSPDAGPPALVGRIAAITGQVSMHRADDQDWSQAGVNEPISVGDALYTQDGGDARLQIGDTDIALKADTEIDLAQLDDKSGQIRLDTGVIDLRVTSLPTEDGLLVSTPRGTVRLTQPGIYRIESGSEDQPTRVTAWNGAAQLGDSSASVNVQPGQTLVISGTQDAPQYSYLSGIGAAPSEWRARPRLPSGQPYVAVSMTGSDDLYEYGSFQPAADYGTVWYPHDVPADWQPYRYGHWEYIAPWGQTWIDDQPWGFAPFHYGRWAHIGNRWGWVPGAYTPHPVYAPALVAFVGGGGFSASISFSGGDAVGWVPLAPGEAYRPPYRAGPTYIENINKTVIINENGPQHGHGGFGPDRQPQTAAGYANRQFATVVPANVMGSARPVAAAAIKVRPDALDHAPVNTQAVTDIHREPRERPAAKPGPVAPPPANVHNAAITRPALPPAGHGPGAAAIPPGAPNMPAHPDARPAAPVVPHRAEAAHQQLPQSAPPPPMPEGHRGESLQPASRPEQHVPAPTPAHPQAEPPRQEPARQGRPEAERAPSAATAPHPQVAEPPRTEPNRPQPHPEAQHAPAARPPEEHRQAEPRPEAARPQVAPTARPEPHPPQAQPPRPQPPHPAPAPTRPAPQPQHAAPPPHPAAPPAAAKEPPPKKSEDK